MLFQAKTDPVDVLNRLTEARAGDEISLKRYRQGLKVLHNLFWRQDSRLQVFVAPAEVEIGEELLQAARAGMEALLRATEVLQRLDPLARPEDAEEALELAEDGFELLLDVRDLNEDEQERSCRQLAHTM